LGIYRSKLDIIADILTVASRNPKKTQIMYQANLSFRNLQKYLAELRESSLICFLDESQCYTITTRGQQFLDAYKEYSKSNRHIEKVLTDVKSKKANLEKLFNQ
jgi:predicted transcriptional regulator